MLKPLPLYLLQERVRGGACSAPHQQHSRWKLRYLFLCCGGAARHQLRSVEITGANGGLRGMHGETLLIFPGRRSSFPHFQKWHNCFESVFFSSFGSIDVFISPGRRSSFPHFQNWHNCFEFVFFSSFGRRRSSFPQGDAPHFPRETLCMTVLSVFFFEFRQDFHSNSCLKTLLKLPERPLLTHLARGAKSLSST